MLTIIKRSGRKEPFNLSKTMESLNTASMEGDNPIPDNELARINAEFKHIIEGKELITSQHITVIMVGLLYIKDYHDVLERYLNYEKNRKH